jgi:hypothetical protein
METERRLLWGIMQDANAAHPPGIRREELDKIVQVVDGSMSSFVLERSTEAGLKNVSLCLKELQRRLRDMRKTDPESAAKEGGPRPHYLISLVRNAQDAMQEYLLIVNTQIETAAVLTQLQDTRLYFGHQDRRTLGEVLQGCGYKLERGELVRSRSSQVYSGGRGQGHDPARTSTSSAAGETTICASCGRGLVL